MFTTMDSQPQEWLLNNPQVRHTVAFCSFGNGAHARAWIDRLVPRDQNGSFLKWSSGRGRDRARRRRLQFIERIERAVDEIDFYVQCISSCESEISECTQAFYLQNLEAISQDTDATGRNYLVFKINPTKVVKVPVLRAARLVWAWNCLKYMKEVRGLDGFIKSDWFAGDAPDGEDPGVGVSLLNFLLQQTGVGLQVSIARNPAEGEAELLSDWFAGLCNSSLNGSVDADIAKRFDALLDRQPRIDRINFRCAFEIHIRREG